MFRSPDNDKQVLDDCAQRDSTSSLLPPLNCTCDDLSWPCCLTKAGMVFVIWLADATQQHFHYKTHTKKKKNVLLVNRPEDCQRTCFWLCRMSRHQHKNVFMFVMKLLCGCVWGHIEDVCKSQSTCQSQKTFIIRIWYLLSHFSHLYL